MKTILLVGKTLEYALYIAACAYMLRIIFSIVIGYVLVKPEDAGPSYYYWRKNYCDIDASKTTYSYMAENSERADCDVFTTYIKDVQPVRNPGKTLEAIKRLKETIESDNERLVGLTGQEAAELTQNIEDNKKKLETEKRELLTKDGFEPLYADSKFTDSFILGPKKTYKIFINRDDLKDISKLEPELNFLNFRLVFIKYMNAIDQDPKYSIVDESSIEKFFSNEGNDALIFKEDSDDPDLTKVSFIDRGDKSFTIRTSRVKPIRDFIAIYTPLKAILTAMKDKKSIVTFDQDDEDNQVAIDGEALKNMIKIVRLSNLPGFSGEDSDASIEAAIKGFFDRISKIKPTAFDSHILNRVYYYFFFMNSSLASNDVLKNDKAYEDAYLESSKADAKAKSLKSSDPDSSKDFSNKAKVFRNKYLERRTQLIFNYLSQLIGANLGDKGYLLDEDKDNRLPFFKWFAYPSVYFSSDEEKHKSIFDDAPVTA
jgi:hypothetical protein